MCITRELAECNGPHCPLLPGSGSGFRYRNHWHAHQPRGGRDCHEQVSRARAKGRLPPPPPDAEVLAADRGRYAVCSRNVRLKPHERQNALCISRSLKVSPSCPSEAPGTALCRLACLEVEALDIEEQVRPAKSARKCRYSIQEAHGTGPMSCPQAPERAPSPI